MTRPKARPRAHTRRPLMSSARPLVSPRKVTLLKSGRSRSSSLARAAAANRRMGSAAAAAASVRSFERIGGGLPSGVSGAAAVSRASRCVKTEGGALFGLAEDDQAVVAELGLTGRVEHLGDEAVGDRAVDEQQ